VAQSAVVAVGTITMLMGAVIGCAKDDIKKALAGSTMSQIGYMMLAAGLGPVGYVFAIFHLVTHGFFKANLFLGAGSVMHGMNDRVDMRTYGALRALMPVTFATFAAGYLAIIGIPPFAGFFSKDLIIEKAMDTNLLVGLCALFAAGITAFYMTRVFAMTFFGERRWEPGDHPHESPRIMTGPLIVLGILSVIGGLVLEYGLGVQSIESWLEPAVGFAEPEHVIAPILLQIITVIVVIIGAVLGWRVYAQRPVPRVQPQQVSALTRAARADLYGDAVNETVFMRPGQYLTRSLVYVDNRGVDGAVLGVASGIGGASARLRRLQNGFVRSYALSMVSGTVVVLGALLLVR
jgi:NADH-quinone oxidoreductase subunit L